MASIYGLAPITIMLDCIYNSYCLTNIYILILVAYVLALFDMVEG